MTDNPSQNNQYAKQPLGKLILIYLIIGGVIYALIYYFVFAGNQGYNTDGLSETPIQQNGY